jgi:SAM-dependent methyltransferase
VMTMKPQEVEALFYDWECRQFLRTQNKDLAFLTSLIPGLQGAVLELGCGSGRVALHLAGAGARVVGLDHSGPMLECLRSKVIRTSAETANRIRLHEADIADFDLGERFSLIVAAYNTLCYLLQPDELRTCIRAVRSHLEPGGRFFCQVSDIAKNREPKPEWELLAADKLSANGDGPFVAMYERVSLEEEKRIVNFHERYALTWPEGHQETHEFTLRMRSICHADIKRVFEEEGLRIVNAYGDLDLSPLTLESADTQIYIAECCE